MYKNLPLVTKIENILRPVVENCTTKSFKERWKWPPKDPEDDLYKRMLVLQEENKIK